MTFTVRFVVQLKQTDLLALLFMILVYFPRAVRAVKAAKAAWAIVAKKNLQYNILTICIHNINTCERHTLA